MAAYPNQNKKLLRVYPLAWLFAYFGAMVVLFLWSLIPGNSESGFSPIAIPIALTLMFLMCVIVYFYVPLSTWLLLFLLHNFVMKDRGSKSTVISVVLAIAGWSITFPVALAFVYMITSGNQFLQIQESSAPFLYLFGGTNLLGLIGAVVWVKLRPQKN
jgi:hypothetical protein